MASKTRFWLRCCSLLAAGLLAGGTAFAQGPDPRGVAAMGAAEPLQAHFERIPEQQLKGVVLNCAREAATRVLGYDEAIPCSIAWETLKRRSFGGDFTALLAWWQAHRDDPVTDQ
ncbi:MAG TPA: hypothetical protein VFR86_29590 [Burkholderiaceae bacterium]|nr:hypothetical protein [Burkholderiaceae bacterium]